MTEFLSSWNLPSLWSSQMLAYSIFRNYKTRLFFYVKDVKNYLSICVVAWCNKHFCSNHLNVLWLHFIFRKRGTCSHRKNGSLRPFLLGEHLPCKFRISEQVNFLYIFMVHLFLFYSLHVSLSFKNVCRNIYEKSRHAKINQCLSALESGLDWTGWLNQFDCRWSTMAFVCNYVVD